MTKPKDDVAWLVTGELKRRPSQHANMRPQHGFQNETPAGVRALNDALARADIHPGAVSPRVPSARVILISLLSEQAAFKLLLSVQDDPQWQRGARKFKVLVGGFGMQNPQPIRHFADYAFFGRAEDEIAGIVDALLHDRPPPASESLLDLTDIPRRPGAVKVRQAYELFDGETFKESFIGCPLKCKFCHYTFARKHTGGDHAYRRSTGSAGRYVQLDGHGNNTKPKKFIHSMEVTLPQLIDWPHEFIPPQLTFGLDGASERIRFLFGKRILDTELQRGIENYAALVATKGFNGATAHVLDILGMPSETTADREQLHRALAGCRPDMSNLKSFFVVIRAVPFKASPWTPLQWEAYHTRFDRALIAGRRICRFPGSKVVRHKNGLTSNAHATYSLHVEGPGSQIIYAMVARHDGSATADRAIRYISAPRFRRAKHARQLADFRNTFGPFAARMLDALPLDTDPPSSVAEGGVPLDTLRRMAEKSRDDMKHNRWRGKRSIMGAAVPAAA